jgi:threonine dehydratase
MAGSTLVLTAADVQSARLRIAPYVRCTSILTSEALDAATGARLYFKCENLQAVGAFKSRGAVNAVFSLSDAEAARGVAAHSSGNHGAALARAARLRGVPAYIVMPQDSAASKVRNVERHGGTITFCAPTPQGRLETCRRVVEETGAALLHPFEDPRVMAGQGTAVLEFLEEVPDLDAVLVPIGGGGLIAGTAVAAASAKPGLQVIGTEPEQSDDAAASFRAGQLVPRPSNTIADGLRAVVGQPNLAIMLRLVEDVVTVSEAGIVAAMRVLWEELRTLVEPSSAVPFAALHERRLSLSGKKVGIILTGGNVDLDRLPWQ